VNVECGAFVVPDASDPEALLEQVLAAERGGLELIGIQDHPYQRRFLDTFTLLAWLAARTARVRLFPDVGNLPLRQPAMLAKAAASIDVLSGGRFELGLGAGAFWDAIEAFGGKRLTGPERAVRRIANVNGVIADGPVEGWLRGPPEHWVAELGALAADHGFDGFVLWSDGDVTEQIGRFAAEVAPALRSV
jgi:alkanesulfonate monooxygenase SsuD/methylene tetrahydromethanopterin reductase-like flavin-dependent oxidoreductase (luciferase family)